MSRLFALHTLTKTEATLYIVFTSLIKSLHGSVRRLVCRSFRLKLNDDAMATEKLAEGIAGFSQAIVKVEEIITAKIQAASS